MIIRIAICNARVRGIQVGDYEADVGRREGYSLEARLSPGSVPAVRNHIATAQTEVEDEQ